MTFADLNARGMVDEEELTEATGGFGGSDVPVVEEELRVVREAEDVIQEIYLSMHIGEEMWVMGFGNDCFVEGKPAVFQVLDETAVRSDIRGIAGHFANDGVRVEPIASGDGDGSWGCRGKPMHFKVDEELGPVSAGCEEDGDGVAIREESTD